MLNAARLSDGLVACDLEHSRRIATVCMFYKIHCNPNHALEAALPGVRVPASLTHLVIYVHSRYLDDLRSCTVQFSRQCVPEYAQH